MFATALRSLTVRGVAERASKTGTREITLTLEGLQFFQAITAGRHPDELLLPRDSGTVWGKSDHFRPMREAVKRAKLPAATTIYALRHTYIWAAWALEIDDDGIPSS